MDDRTSREQWLGFASLVVIVVLAVVGFVVFVVSGWSGCACTTAPAEALSGLGTLW